LTRCVCMRLWTCLRRAILPGRSIHSGCQLNGNEKMCDNLFCCVLCALRNRLLREDEVDQRSSCPAPHGRCTARHTVVRDTLICRPAIVAPRSAPVTATRVRHARAFGNVRVHTARHRMQDLWLCVFQFAACYEAHLPSVTVRDENAGRAQRTASTLSSCAQPTDKRCGRAWMMTTRCIAMSVGKVSDGTQRDHGGHLPETAATSETTDHVRKKRLFQGTQVLSAVQCVPGNA
jgi:hypothetical protein